MPDELRLNTANIVLLQQMATHGACIETIDAMFKGRVPHPKIAAAVSGEKRGCSLKSARGAPPSLGRGATPRCRQAFAYEKIEVLKAALLSAGSRSRALSLRIRTKPCGRAGQSLGRGFHSRHAAPNRRGGIPASNWRS